MSGAEALHRLGRALDLVSLRISWRFASGICRRRSYEPVGFCAGGDRRLPSLPWRGAPGAAEIARLLAGEWPALGFPWRWRQDPAAWRTAPDTGKLWPDRFFGSIPYRPGNPCGDARLVWEPSRLQQLVALALVAARWSPGRAGEAVAVLEQQFVSWVATNPPLTGIHYASSMECALRIIAVCHALDLVRERIAPDSETWRVLPGFIAGHARLIERRLSLYSSRGNHTIAECAGLVYAALLFPELPWARQWRQVGLFWLAREAERQILDDGGGIEQSFWYHLFVLDLCGLVLALLQHRNEAPPPGLADAVARGRRFLAAFADGPASLPDIGDRDGGYALSRWLGVSWSGERAEERVLSFRASGYSRLLLADNPGSYVVLDHGPLGMPPAFGHAHADALSLVFVRGGRPVLADPGTYGYGLDPEWRRYFRGTRAHNTVVVGGRDQARQETAFQWSRPYRAELVKLERLGDERMLALARHDGYAPLGITHWRGVVLERGVGFLVWDFVGGSGMHDIAAHWHCAAGVEPAGPGSRFLLSDRETPISFEASGGEVSVDSGWAAPDYGVKAPMPTLRLHRRTSLPHALVTRIRLDGRFAALDGEERAIEALTRWTAHG